MSKPREWKQGERCLVSGVYINTITYQLVRVEKGRFFPPGQKGRATYTFVSTR